MSLHSFARVSVAVFAVVVASTVFAAPQQGNQGVLGGVGIATEDRKGPPPKPAPRSAEGRVVLGGEIWACGACAKPRGITDAHLIPGARIVTAAMVVEAMAKGASTLGF